MNKPYILLSGAIKNIGDFLIFDSAKKLIKKYVSENIIELNRWEDHSDKIDLLNSSRGIIICGGPGFARNMYPDVYPIVKDLSELKVPITTLGVGWSGKPTMNPNEFEFSENSKRLLDYIQKSNSKLSCRDVITEKILNANGYENTIMTGCPVWYREQDTSTNLNRNISEIKEIVFTTPANRKLTKQTLKVIDIIKQKFPKAEVVVSFHRGIFPGLQTGLRNAAAYLSMSGYSLLKGFSVKDVSGDLKKMDFYQDADLHIGYRVHGHLFFLANGLPSILFSEDGRGIGMSRTFNLPELYTYDNDFIQKFDDYIDKFIESDFPVTGNNKIISEGFETMKNFLEELKIIAD